MVAVRTTSRIQGDHGVTSTKRFPPMSDAPVECLIVALVLDGTGGSTRRAAEKVQGIERVDIQNGVIDWQRCDSRRHHSHVE